MRKTLMVAALGAFAFALSACDVEQTKEGDMPEVDVKGGNLPEYDVDAADVDVTTEKRTIEVPDVDIKDPDAGNNE